MNNSVVSKKNTNIGCQYHFHAIIYIKKSEINTNQINFNFILYVADVMFIPIVVVAIFFFISFVTDWIFDIISFHLRHLIKKYMHCVFHSDFNELDLCFSLIKYESFVFHLIFIFFFQKKADWLNFYCFDINGKIKN